MKKFIQVIATFLVIFLISGTFILWPQIETYLFGEDEEYVITPPNPPSDAFTEFRELISIFSEKNWDKMKYRDLLEDLDIHKGETLISVDEYTILKKNLEDAYTTTLKNSIKNWTNNRCVDDSIKVIQEEIFGIADTNLTYKGYLEEEIEILNTYNEITKDLSDDVNYLKEQKFDTLKVRRYKSKISSYKRNKHFNKCVKVINIVKDAESEIQNYEMYVKEFNENIIYYIENYKVVRECNNKHYYSCKDYIEENDEWQHNRYLEDRKSDILDDERPYKFDHTSNGDPLSCYDYNNYTYYYNELKTKEGCD